MSNNTQPQVAVIMGSRSDWPAMKLTVQMLEDLGVVSVAKVISAHRKAHRLGEFIRDSEAQGVRVFVAGAGGAAHLPGVVASMTTRPVVGVPMKTSLSGGLDSLLSIVQMPRGVPVATVATGEAGAVNAAILSAQILGVGDEAIAQRVAAHRKAQAESLEESPE